MRAFLSHWILACLQWSFASNSFWHVPLLSHAVRIASMILRAPTFLCLICAEICVNVTPASIIITLGFFCQLHLAEMPGLAVAQSAESSSCTLCSDETNLICSEGQRIKLQYLHAQTDLVARHGENLDFHPNPSGYHIRYVGHSPFTPELQTFKTIQAVSKWFQYCTHVHPIKAWATKSLEHTTHSSLVFGSWSWFFFSLFSFT